MARSRETYRRSKGNAINRATINLDLARPFSDRVAMMESRDSPTKANEGRAIDRSDLDKLKLMK